MTSDSGHLDFWKPNLWQLKRSQFQKAGPFNESQAKKKSLNGEVDGSGDIIVTYSPDVWELHLSGKTEVYSLLFK